jgi:MipA family protein
MTCFRLIKPLRNKRRILLTVVMFMLAPLARAETGNELPKFEIGPALVYLSIPEYRGSSHQINQLVPFPYLKYRGEKLRVDDGIEGRLFKTPDLLLSISGNGSLPSSDKNSERAGMQDLDATLELGPSLELRLLSEEETALWLELPLRFALAVGRNINSIGYTFHPRLAWRKPERYKEEWKLRVAGGPLFADRKYHAYFYDVDSSEVTPERAAYSADSGFSGTRLDFTFSRRIQQWWLGGFVRYDDLSASVIEDSPLVSQPRNWTFGLSLAYVLAERY